MAKPSSSTSDDKISILLGEEVISTVAVEPRPRTLHRVPLQVCAKRKHIYEPTALPLGPYHHGAHLQFHQAEMIKTEVLNIVLDSKDKGFFCSKFLERVGEIRDFYRGFPTHGHFGDESLAEMMLRDTCFVLHYMEVKTRKYEEPELISHRLGRSGALLADLDLCMLENQIPFWAIRLLISLKYTDDDHHLAWEALLCKYLSRINYGSFDILRRVPWEDQHEPLHLLEAHRATLLKEHDVGQQTKGHHRRSICFKIIEWIREREERKISSDLLSSNNLFEKVNQPFRSVTELKAKGIHFEPSSKCLKDIRFNSYWFYGKLELPNFLIGSKSKVFISNLIAFEMSPETCTNFEVTSFVNFMKALLESPGDVKELREKGILLSVRNDEQVLKLFKKLDTYGWDGLVFREIKMKIDRHCGIRSRTWMAELIHTKFRSPWTAIALISAAILLCLTFLQTFFTINPP